MPRKADPVVGTPAVPDGYLLTTRAFTTVKSMEWADERHPEHELLWSEGGVLTLEAGDRRWNIPPELGVWIPAGLPHRVSAERDAKVRVTYFVTTVNVSAMPDGLIGIAVTEPLRALLTHNIQGELSQEARLRLQHVILDLLVPAPQGSFDLVMPRTAQLRAIAYVIIHDPADKRTTDDWARESGFHARTLARRFETETGMTLTQWRIVARLQRAIRELGQGAPVVSVARRLGYRNPSTFIDHFRSLTGQTPAEYSRSPRDGEDLSWRRKPEQGVPKGVREGQ